MMRPPPPTVTSIGFPSLPSTIVGVIDESIRLPGAIAFASPITSPSLFATPGCAVKSSISLLSRNPAPGTTDADPFPELIVVVSATALPCPLTTEKWVVCFPSGAAPVGNDTAADGVALSGRMVPASVSANSCDRSRSDGTLTNPGSPRK